MTLNQKKIYTHITLVIEKRQSLNRLLSNISDASFSLMSCSVSSLISLSSDSPSALKTLTILHAKDSHSSVWGATQGFLSLSQWWKFSISLVHFLSIYIIFFIVQLQSCKTLEPHGWQHARLPCPSLSPGVKFMFIELVMLSNHLIFCHPFSFCLQSFPASGSFPVSQLFASGVQSIGVSASASVLPMNIQDWLPLGWMDWFDFLAVLGILKSLLQHHNSKASWFSLVTYFIQSEISQKEKNKCHILMRTCGIWKNWYRRSYLQSRNWDTDLETKGVATKGEVRVEMNWEVGTDIHIHHWSYL